MAEANESTPLIPSDTTGARPSGAFGSESAPAGRVSFSPGGQSFNRVIDRFRDRPQHLRKALGGPARIIPRRTSERDEDENDPLAGSRVQMPYQELVDQAVVERGAQAALPRVERTSSTQQYMDPHRRRYYNSIQNHIVNTESVNRTPEEMARVRERRRRARERGEDLEEDEDIEFSHAGGILSPPEHLLTPDFYRIHVPGMPESPQEEGTSDFVTITSIWNTMMGTSLLTQPWAIMMAGSVLGPVIIAVMTMTAFYTAYIIISMHKKEKEKNPNIPLNEFSDLCGHVVDRSLNLVCGILSLLAVFGAATVYIVLMSNYMTNTGIAIYNIIYPSHAPPSGNESLICHAPLSNQSAKYLYVQDSHSGEWEMQGPLMQHYSLEVNSTGDADVDAEPCLFDSLWTHKQVVMYLVLPLLVLTHSNNIAVFSKLNSVATVCIGVLYAVIFRFAFKWGLNINFRNPASATFAPFYRPSFSKLSGTLSLGLFIHNCIITIMSNNKNQHNNTRNLAIGFFLVGTSYFVIGYVFYATFPLAKDCIADNFLDNFTVTNTYMEIVRACLLLQLILVFPLILFILRKQFYQIVRYVSDNPSILLNTFINLLVIAFGVFITRFFPNIGQIISITGSICGFGLVFTLPIIVDACIARREKRLKWWVLFIQGLIILAGLANLVMQFVL